MIIRQPLFRIGAIFYEATGPASKKPLTVDLESLVSIVTAFYMKWAFVIMAAGMLLTGCKTTDKGGEGKKDSTEVTPVVIYTGKIALVKKQLKYVVVEGAIGEVPGLDTVLNAYRDDKKVGELKVSGEARGSNYAADITKGDLSVGDIVRSN